MIQYYLCDKTQALTDFITSKGLLTPNEFSFILNFGGIYINQKRVVPHTHPINIHSGDILRIHFKPKQFLTSLMDQFFIIKETKDWVCIFKPSGIPSHETLDNFFQNAKQWAIQKIGCPLFSLNRLDVGTQGLLLFAKTKAFCSYYNLLLQEQNVKKIYHVYSKKINFNENKIVTHYMKKSDRAPKQLITETEHEELIISDQKNYLKCEIKILSEELISNSQLETLNKTFNLNVDQVCFLKYSILLMTGRTHQIRAQFSKMGSPLLGDELYNSPHKHNLNYEFFTLSCHSLSWDMETLSHNIDFFL